MEINKLHENCRMIEISQSRTDSTNIGYYCSRYQIAVHPDCLDEKISSCPYKMNKILNIEKNTTNTRTGGPFVREKNKAI
jgi:hypothetical protein